MELNCEWCQAPKTYNRNLVCSDNACEHYICSDCFATILFPDSATSNQVLTMPETDDQRNAVRHPVFGIVRITPKNRGITVTSALILDASRTGLRLETKVYLNEDEEVGLLLNGESNQYQAFGRVVYSQSMNNEAIQFFQTGIRLLDSFEIIHHHPKTPPIQESI